MSGNKAANCLHTSLSVAVLSAPPQVASQRCKLLLNVLFRVILGLPYFLLPFDRVQEKAGISAAFPPEYMYR